MGPKFDSLKLNAAARELWGCWGSEGGVAAVMLTFGSGSMTDFLLNWIEHVKRLGPEVSRLYLVGALDEKMEKLCEEHGIPAATITPAAMEANGIAQSVGQLGRSSSSYYRYAAGTFLKMGLVKEVFIRQMLEAGLDAMVSDVDVAWLSSPWPLVRYPDSPAQPPPRPSARLLALADVILSVDQVQQYMDSDKYHWHIHSELNTGVIFFRNSDGARAVLAEWREAMAAAIRKGDPNHDQYWLNGVLRPREFHNLKDDATARARWYPALIRQLDERRARAAAARGAGGAGGVGRHGGGGGAQLGRPVDAAAFDARNASLRPIFEFKSKLFGAEKVAPTVGTFPIAEVSNGHTFFVQRLHEIVAVPPVAVHCTYQYGDDTGYAYGKRQRLRDAGLWLVDPPSYYEEGRYLQVVSGLAEQLAPDVARLLDPEVLDPEHCVRSHLKLQSLQRQLLHDAFLLAKATGRALILPPIWCNLDRFWTILDHCLIGKKVEMPLPFVCPLDHSFLLPSFIHADLDFREYTFLSSPRVPAALRASRLRVRVGGGDAADAAAAGSTAAAGGAADGTPGAAAMARAEVAAAAASVAVSPAAARAAAASGLAPRGESSTDAAAARAAAQAAAAAPAARVAQGADLSELARAMGAPGVADVRVLQLHVSDMRRLCRCAAGLPAAALALNAPLQRALGSSYHYCDTTDNPYFVECRAHGRQGCRKHRTYLMNVSRGLQQPPLLPADKCGGGGAPDMRACGRYHLPDEHISEGVRTQDTPR